MSDYATSRLFYSRHKSRNILQRVYRQNANTTEIVTPPFFTSWAYVLRGKLIFAFSMKWYVLHTRSSINERKLRETVEECSAVKEAYIPLQRRERLSPTGTKRIHMVPVLPSTVFVYTEYHALRKFIIDRFIPCNFITDSNRDVHHPMVIPDDHMLLFRRLCDDYPYKIDFLNKSFAQLENCDIVTIKNGPLAGLQGKFKEIKNDFKLILGLGNVTLALSNVQKFQIFVDCPALKSSEQNKLYHLIDTCLAHLHSYGFVDNAHQKLRVFLSLLDQGYDIDDCTEQLRQTDASLSRTLSSITRAQKSDFATLAFNIKMRHDKLDLDTQIPSSPLRPFLTIEPGVKHIGKELVVVEHDGFSEVIIRKEFSEPRITDETTGEYKLFTNKYYAHVGVIRLEDNTLCYALNFHDFYERYDSMDDSGKQDFQDKLAKYNADLFLKILSGNEENNIHFSTLAIGHQSQHCLCLCTKDADLAPESVATLINVGHNLCCEIIGNTHLRTWRNRLYKVWLRR